MSNAAPVETLSREPFGKMPDGSPVEIFTLRNAKGMTARITNYGGTIVSLTAPDKNGSFADVVLGCDTLKGYFKNDAYLGAVIGRCGNRIAKGRFTLDGKVYTLAVNNGPNHLHGGLKGFNKTVWQARTLAANSGPALELTRLSKDGEEGYPGNLKAAVVYSLTDDNALRIDITATTDKKTVVNLTHHSYFNLRGSGDVLDHTVHIFAEKFTPVDSTLIPTGELRSLAGTPFDFRRATAIGARIYQDDEQLKFGNGYDHNWVIDKPPGKLGLAARVKEPVTGRILELFTSEPGLQFYTANYLDGGITGKRGWRYGPREGFCLEPQHFPDSPNKPAFPSVKLEPGETYQNTIIYKFSVTP